MEASTIKLLTALSPAMVQAFVTAGDIMDGRLGMAVLDGGITALMGVSGYVVAESTSRPPDTQTIASSMLTDIAQMSNILVQNTDIGTRRYVDPSPTRQSARVLALGLAVASQSLILSSSP